ncbi:AraC family transcriptional regulator [Marinobacter salinisoli]|uniref:AraC family transcriptional regulator n=1 Tax=Marinobacter salinisoli TaxID=2769486 RepID=A0ABX7MU86_9GAMM|nr:AraC family transcriptional regulator [Marinobacter salinisoli]QSP95901.1 AraC family transcriptional regulator [Marinobacter salinisoli]
MNAPTSAANQPFIHAHYADILCQLVQEKGVSRPSLLSAAGIRPGLLEHPDNLISIPQFVALCRECLQRSGDPALGLAFGLRLKFTTHGALSQAAVSCDTLEQAISVLIKYCRTRFVYMALSFFTESDEAVLQLDVVHQVDDLRRFTIDLLMASLMDVNQLLFGDKLTRAGCCRFAYPEPEDTSPYRGLFGDIVEFGGEANQMRFQAQFLALPLVLSNPVTRRMAEAQCEEQMRTIEATASMADKVERILASTRDGRLPGLEQVADQLLISPRTLRRQLTREGLRFKQLQDRIRHERSLVLLRRQELNLDAIADALGYSDPSNFARAFRKWEGVAPSVWRQRDQQEIRPDHVSR